MNILLSKFLGRIVRFGNLEVIDAGGALHRFGDGAGEPVRIRFTSAGAERRVVVNTQMKLGEEYMSGGYVIEAGSVYDFVLLLASNLRAGPHAWLMPAVVMMRRVTGALARLNSPSRARRNVAHHYDLDQRLFNLFLDKDLQYSCAYFEEGVTDLDAAQLAKKRHIASKLLLRPGQRVLDIGSGWGGLGLYLAQHFDVEVVGVTLSEEQHAVSNRRAKEHGLDDRARFLLKDYRMVEGEFDRIVSVGMFEHVGKADYGRFFSTLSRLLAGDGVALLHTIAKRSTPGPIGPWIKRYIFPGAYLPTLSQLAPAVEKADFWLTDLESWRLHYARTLAAWNRRFQARRSEAAALFDERFCRMWEFYFQVCEMAFQMGDLIVLQLQLAKNVDTVPITRDYMYRPPLLRMPGRDRRQMTEALEAPSKSALTSQKRG